jgi:hypothetical protein
MLLECKKKLDWSEMYPTKLYINHGCEYCRLLEIAAKYNTDDLFKKSEDLRNKFNAALLNQK